MSRTNFTVQIMRANVPNGNAQIYSMSALEHCVALGREQSIFGMLGAPSGAFVDLSNVSHTVENLRIEGEYLVGDVCILQTDKGHILLKLLDEVQIDFRAAGTGTLDKSGVMTEFKLISIDALYDGVDL